MARAVRDLGSQVAVADFLGVSRSTLAQWADGSAPVPPVHEERLGALNAVLDHLRPHGRGARSWLHTPCARLDGALPLDVLLVDGPVRVRAAFDDDHRRS